MLPTQYIGNIVVLETRHMPYSAKNKQLTHAHRYDGAMKELTNQKAVWARVRCSQAVFKFYYMSLKKNTN